MEQPELGSSFTGRDGLALTFAWAWESGWTIQTSYRLSGASGWQQRTYDGLDALEAHALASDWLAEQFGLI